MYQVSNFGEVRRFFSHYVRNRLVKTVHTLKPDICKGGYMRVSLYKNNRFKRYLVHRIVWEAFNGLIPEGIQVNHIDENKSNNRLDNLNLLTCTENINWGTRTKRAAQSNKNNPLKSKPVRQYTIDGKFIKEYPSAKQVKRELGYFDTNIGNCCKGIYKTAYGFVWRYAD